MADTSKDTIYIDVDDEITSIIEKVSGSERKIVALVLPKRASSLQSIVNMKLLKRTAEHSGKKIVLITSESNLLPIAGAVKVHVARTLQSKPSIPPPPEVSKQDDTVEADDNSFDKSKSIGELAGMPDDEPPAKVSTDETIDIDNSDDESGAVKATGKSKNKDSKIKIPNFEKFRTKLMLGGAGLFLLILFWVFAIKVWPHATVTIKTNNSSVNAAVTFTADSQAQSLDTSKNIVPATVKNSDQTDSLKVAATGQKNVGDKATGSVSLQNCTATVGSVTVPQGTTVSTSGLSFTTQTNVVLPATTKNGLNQCTTPSKDVGVEAQSSGTGSNISAGKHFAVSGYSNISGTNSSAFSGGTDKTITVVSQSDVDAAKKKITDNTDAAKTDLTKQLTDAKLFPLPDTIQAGKQTVSSSVKVGDEATEVEVTVQTNYTMLGVQRDDLKKLVEKEAKKSIDTSKQAISDDGLDKATFSVTTKKSATNQTLSVQTTATAGAQIDTNALKAQLTGKKKGDIEQIVQALPSVESVSTKFSPFWVNKTPSSTSKINIIVQNNQVSANGSNGN